MSSHNSLQRVCLFLLLGIALLLRLQGWHPFAVVDEDTILAMVWGLHLDPLPPGMPLPLPGYPPFFIYLNYFLSLLYREVLLFLGVFSSAAEFLASPLARNFTLKAGQLLVAFLGTLQVAVIWKVGKEFFNSRVAWLAALLIAFHPHLVLNGHIFKSDVPLALLFSLLLLYSLRFLKTRGNKEFFIACFLAGLTAACKYNGAVEILILPFLLWLSRKDLEPGRWRKLLLLSPVFGLLGFLVFAPNWVAHPVASFKAAYSYAVFHFQEFTFYDQVSSTYGRYAVDLWLTIGPLFLLLFLIGLVFAVLRREKNEITIAVSLLFYFIIQGRSVFFGSRIILPILGAVALLAATGAFQHLLPLLRRPFLRHAFSALIFAGVLVFSLGNAGKSIALYNLWKTSSTFDEAVAFRKGHIPAHFPFGREAFTPRYDGDRGYWDIVGIPDAGLFRGPEALPFLTTGILADHLFHKSRDTKLKEELRFRLGDYRTFHTVSKPHFGPWDGDILFWYRPHPRLAAIRPQRETVFLPRLFRENAGNTLFLPLQPYEKDPGFFSLQGAYFGKWILSAKPLASVSISIFCPDGEITAAIKLNNRKLTLKASFGASEITLPAPRPFSCQQSPLYRLEALLPEKHPPAFLLFQDRSAVGNAEEIILSSTLANDPPPLFSVETPPAWVRELYRKTGLDLSLMSLTQEMILFENKHASLLPFASDWIMVPKGAFRWEIQVEPISTAEEANDPPALAIEIMNNGRFSTQALFWQKIATGRYTALFENLEEKCLLRIHGADFRLKNLLLQSIRIRPDYLHSFQRGLIFRGSGQ